MRELTLLHQPAAQLSDTSWSVDCSCI